MFPISIRPVTVRFYPMPSPVRRCHAIVLYEEVLFCVEGDVNKYLEKNKKVVFVGIALALIDTFVRAPVMNTAYSNAYCWYS